MSQLILLAGVSRDGTHDVVPLDRYEAIGGYDALRHAMAHCTPDDVVQAVKDAGLRGRGGAGFPTGTKWGFLDRRTDKPRYLVCNADESEPGTFKDRYLMEKVPHRLIEGIILSAYALGVHTAFIYIRGELMWLKHQLEKAIAEATHAGYLGDRILGSDYSLRVVVHPGAGAYICGEESALLESLEGKRGNPRQKPPFPAVSGLYGCPTVINNVESLASVPWIVRNGGAAYRQLGVGNSTGTKLISASGHINRPGVYEVVMGLSVQEFIESEAYCGGIRNGRTLKAVVPGGSSVPVLPAHLALRTAAGEPRLLTYESLADGGFVSGSMLGSGGFIVMDDTTCMVRNTWNFSRFYHHESCGQCSPCREGTGWLERVLHRLEHGHGSPEDIDLLVDITKKIEGNTICTFGDAASWPVASAVRHFRGEFEYHAYHPDKVKSRQHPIVTERTVA